MSKVKIQLLPGGAKALMKSPEIVAELEKHADAALRQLPRGYEKSVYPNGKSRANVSVYTETESAMQDNAKNNSLLRAIGGKG